MKMTIINSGEKSKSMTLLPRQPQPSESKKKIIKISKKKLKDPAMLI